MLPVVVILAAACQRPLPAPDIPWVPEPAADLGPVVARIGEVPIFAEQVSAQARKTGKPPREAVNDLIAFHLLAERLRSAWPPTDSDATHARQQILVQRMLERELEANIEPRDLPEQTLRSVYTRAIKNFVHPRLVEVYDLMVLFPNTVNAEQRAIMRKTAADVRAEVERRRTLDRSKPLETIFQEIATDAAWKSRRVNVYKYLQTPEGPYEPSYYQAVLKLKAVGDLTPTVEEGSGIHLAAYSSEKPAKNISFEEARQEVHTKYLPIWRQEQFREFTARATKGHKIEVFEANLQPAAPQGRP